jgi:hypothetical protein
MASSTEILSNAISVAAKTHANLVQLETNLQMLQQRNRNVTPLPDRQWELLEQCEKPLYQDEHGSHAYTGVMPNDGDILLLEMWQYATIGAEGMIETNSPENVEREAARRVSAVFAVLAFGREFLLK